MIHDFQEQADQIDIESRKLDAVIQLKIWQKNISTLVENVYATRLKEIDQVALNLTEEIQTRDKTAPLKADIIVQQIIPDNLKHLIERTIRIRRDEEQSDDDDDDDLVIIDIETAKEEKIGERVLVVLPTAVDSESRVSKILHSEPVQQALAATLTTTLTHMGALAATSTTTIAATTIAKTALLSTACGIGTMAFGIGRIAIGTTQKVWSLVTSSNAI